MKLGAKKDKKNKKNKNRVGSAKNLLAVGTMGALMACSAIDNGFVKPAYASLGSSMLTAGFQVQDQTKTYTFNIPAGSLDRAIKAYQELTGVQVQLQNDAINTLFSSGANGAYTAEEGLKQILTGTDVAYKFTTPQTITLELTALSDVVEVRSPQQILSSPKYNTPLLTTPQSISIINREVIQKQAATTLRDVVRNVAGISIATGEGGNQGDSLTIRGFSARNDLYIDSMRDFGSYYRDPFNIEEVAVIRGAASVTSGRGSTGGSLNQSSKLPQLRTFITGTLEFGSDETKRATLDLNTPIEKFGKGAAFRLNVMGTDAGVAGRDVTQNRRFGFAPSLALGLGTSTRFTASYYHQSANDIPDYGIPFLFDRPAPVDRANYYGFKNGNKLDVRVDIGTLKIEHDFNSHISVRNMVRYSRYEREALITQPSIATPVSINTPLSAIRVNRGQIFNDSEEKFVQNQLDITTNFQAGFAKFNVVGGIEAGRETSSPLRISYANVPSTSLLNPTPDDPFGGTPTITSDSRGIGVSFAAYVVGTVSLGSKLDLSAGVRRDHFDVNVEQFIGANKGKLDRVDDFTSYRAGIVFKPVRNVSLYTSYSTSFNPSAETITLNAQTANLPPEKNQNFEIGAKYDFLRRYSVRGAIFRLEKQNARETDPTNALLTVLSGKQRVEGFEFEATGRLTNRLILILSYAYLDSEVKESRFFPRSIGVQLPNTPKNSVSFAASYDLPWRLTVGANGQYIDNRLVSSTAPTDPTTGRIRFAPRYFVMNMNASRSINEYMSVQVNVYNIANNNYIDQLGGSRIVPGASRSVKVGLNFKIK